MRNVIKACILALSFGSLIQPVQSRAGAAHDSDPLEPPAIILPPAPSPLSIFAPKHGTGIGSSAMKPKCWQLISRTENQESGSAVITDRDAYDVYETVLRMTSMWRTDTNLVVVADTVAQLGCCEDVSPAKPEWVEAFANFIDVNKQTWRLEPFALPKGLELLSHADLKSMYRIPPKSAGYAKQQEAVLAGQAEFRTRYPDSSGYIRLSAVGFNRRRDRAVVYTQSSCGFQCGQGGIHYLERDENGWHESISGGPPWCAWIA